MVNNIIGVPISNINRSAGVVSSSIKRILSDSDNRLSYYYYFNNFENYTVGSTPTDMRPYGGPIIVDEGGNKVCQINGSQSISVEIFPASNYVKFTAKVRHVSGTDNWCFGFRQGSESVTMGNWGDSCLSIYYNYNSRVATATNVDYRTIWHTFSAIFNNGLFTVSLDGANTVTYNNPSFTKLDCANFGSWGSGKISYVDDFKVETV